MSSAVVDDKFHFQARMIVSVCGIAWAAVTYSYAGSIISTTLGQPTFIEYMGLATNPHAADLTGSVVGLFYAGGIFGAVLNSIICDRIGRKWTTITGSLIVLISTACLSGSVNIGMFISFRFFVGLGAWMLFLSVPLWVIELSPPRGRSILGGIVGLSGVIGYLIAGYIGVGFFYYKSGEAASWRAPIALGCFPPLIFLLFAYWLPESPRWLLAKDRYDEAWQIVRSLHATNDDPNHEYATAEMYQMNQQHELDRLLKTSWIEMLRRPSYRKRAAIAFILPWIMYSTGDLVVTTYAASIFEGIGYDASQTIQFTAAILWAALVGNLISLTYVDRVPRHIILSVGILAVLAVLIIETALQASFPATSTNRAGLAAAGAFIFVFLFTFNLFLEGPGWYYASEIFPTHLRAKGMTINIIGLCCVDLTWLELAPTGFAKIQWKFYLVFICISIFGAALIFFTFPDTLRKPLEEVACLFGDDDLVAVYQGDNHRDHEKHDELQERQKEPHVGNTETREDLQGYDLTTHGAV